MVLHVEQFVGRTRVISSTVALIALLTGCQADDPTGASATDTGEIESTGLVTPTTGAAPTSTGWDTNWDPSSPDGTGGMSGTTTTGPDETTGPVDPSTTTSTTGDEQVDCEKDPENPLCEIPPEDHEPTTPDDGVPSPIPGVYDDQGPAPPDAGVRALIGFPTRDRAKLEALVEDIYDPASPNFRKYITVDQWMADHAPDTADVTLVKAWLQSEGFTINWVASNRMLIHFSGTAADFNETFQTELHICMRKNPQAGLPPFPVYCVIDVDGFTMPKFISDRTTGLLTADLPAEDGMLSNEGGKVVADPPPADGGYGPAQIAGAYGLKPLYEAGFTGKGSSIGVIAAGTYHSIDLQIFWASFGVSRTLPTRVSLLEPVHERITETILDTQWSTSMAPGADVFVYEGPDARNTSLLYLWNEAIYQNKVDVITNSFAHREDSEPKPLRHQYDHSALMAAALGITLVSASGDSARPDTPCGSPYVTCVGGTRLKLDPDGEIMSESAWGSSGSGDSISFPVPYWQDGEDIDKTRAVCDLALNASPAYPYWIRRYGKWEAYGGTSFASPSMAGIVAVINGKRKAEGKPRVGFLNPLIYLHQPTRDTFRDITSGQTDIHEANAGWDYPTGLGAPDAEKLAAALP